MIYVSKTDQDAIDFVAEFLNRGFNEEEGNNKYVGVGFEQIKNPVNRFRQFFVSEQNEKCCYCCRAIDNTRKTELEHIIPRAKKTIEDFQPYYDLSKTLQENVVPQSVFEMTSVRLKTPPFPHHVAYHNIMASCDGRIFESSSKESFTCCNRERHDTFVPPFNLMENTIKYLPDGTIVYINDLTNRDYFEILNLDKVILNKIRRLWFLFSKSTLDVSDILNDEYTETITEKIVAFAIANSNTPLVDSNLTATFSTTETWNVFKQYDFFFNYYRKNN